MGDIFLFVILFVYGFAVILMGCVALKNKKYKNKNNVHFYVARDKNGNLWLYIGKPFRGDTEFYTSYKVVCLADDLSRFGLKYEDFDSLKWEDEPVEVFLNLEK